MTAARDPRATPSLLIQFFLASFFACPSPSPFYHHLPAHGCDWSKQQGNEVPIG